MPKCLPSLSRLRGAAPIACLAVLTAACGSGTGSKATTSTTSSSSTSSHSSSRSSSQSDTGSVALGDVVLTSTLARPENRFGTGPSATQDDSGITLHVAKAGGTFAFSTMQDWHGIPDNLNVEVQADENTPNKLYFGVACRGLDQNNTYLLLVDMQGDYAIVQVINGNQKLLKQGSKAFTPDGSGTVTVDAACVTPASNDKMNHLELSADGTTLATVDDSFENVAQSNTFALFAISPDTSTGTGDVTFHDLEVRSATAP